MASNETVKPKGILKHSSSLDHRDSVSHKEMTWDEMNILATHHPADKDYGHMKIDEPPTPYSKCSDVEDEEGGEETRRGSVGEKLEVDPNALASRLTDNMDPTVLRHARVAEDDDDDDDDEEEEEEDDDQKEQRHNFELKRKLHYNEYQAVQLAKKLMSEEEEEEEEENDKNSTPDKMDLSSPPSSDDKPT